MFDFTGTGYEVFGNCNAPKAVTYSAIIYCLRCMVGHDVPLNQGCLAPITTIVRPACSLMRLFESTITDPRGQHSVAIAQCCCCWRQRSHVAACRRRHSQSVQCLRRLAGKMMMRPCL